ncbi:hypothetical protein [Corynebacterium ulceribovis]|uniref:hypothetical protein n=1 Tax=Corynebacterium ulceribovis TaxID=487732 RepID=UPI000361FAF8|nr:hypothetical protein [Corynebacterium ulceribovis]
MIRVVTALQDDPIEHDCPACEVTDTGALLILADTSGMTVSAGYAAGVWASFEMDGA